MPIIKSAKKRVRTASKATARNVKTKRGIKAALKAFGSSVSTASHRKAQSALDKAAKKNVMHKNKVARKQRQLAAKAKAAGVKNTKAVKAAAPKKSATKKTVSKTKPVAKKVTPKKKTSKK
jgi:small subunit ribosomal protein S20